MPHAGPHLDPDEVAEVIGAACRRRAACPGVVPTATREPGDLPAADSAGRRLTRDGARCSPLTAAGPRTRSLLA